MADDRQTPETPASVPVPSSAPAPVAAREKEPKVTENPGEGSYMFSDWALI